MDANMMQLDLQRRVVGLSELSAYLELSADVSQGAALPRVNPFCLSDFEGYGKQNV